MLQQFKLARAQFDFCTAAADFAFEQVDAEVIDTQQVAGIARFSAHHGVQSCGQFFDEERLRHIIICTQVQALDFFRQRGACGEEDDGHVVALFTQAAQDAQAVAPGHHDVEHQGIVGHGRRHFPGFIAIADGVHLNALLLQPLFGKGKQFGLVFDKENAHAADDAARCPLVHRQVLK